MTVLPATQTALVGDSAGHYRLDTAAPMPGPPGPGMLLCAVRAVGLNPADWKMIDFSPSVGSVGGNEFAGEVLAVGSDVGDRFHVGDRILAVTFGLDPESRTSGAFGEYALATADLACRIPPDMGYEAAASLAVALTTATAVLYQMLGLPEPGAPADDEAKKTYVLVSGGATATGTIAIQLLKASGVIPLATCSPENRDRLLGLGAAETFDYHEPACGMAIRTYTNNRLAHVLDCVTQAESTKLAYAAIGSGGGRYVALDPVPARIKYTRRDVEADWLVGYSLFGRPVRLAGAYGRPARPQDRVFGQHVFADVVAPLLASGRLQPHALDVRTGGLAGVAQGIEDLRQGVVRARKVVYSV